MPAGGVVCGQALMALADTSMVLAIVSANRGYRPMTTVDQTTHFMRAVSSSDVWPMRGSSVSGAP